jgi:ATP-binding cassette subfamily B protein
MRSWCSFSWCDSPSSSVVDHASGLGAMDHLAERAEAALHIPVLAASATPVRLVADSSIEFDRVGYRYPGADSPALSGVSFRCPPGTTTALVGPSGSGKTTLIRLAARFLDTDTGTVRVGGVDVRDYDHSALLSEIAIVFQDVYLFDTTIEENVRLARPDADQADLEAAARAARLDEVVARLPDGWRTRVDEAGAQLSGGERQRVAIARAFLKRARIVLIDEAASALDPENEAAVGRAIAALGRDNGLTVIVIAHRPTTLEAADQVVALEAGHVTEIGTPAELFGAGGVFARLNDQYRDAREWRIQRQVKRASSSPLRLAAPAHPRRRSVRLRRGGALTSTTAPSHSPGRSSGTESRRCRPLSSHHKSGRGEGVLAPKYRSPARQE